MRAVRAVKPGGRGRPVNELLPRALGRYRSLSTPPKEPVIKEPVIKEAPIDLQRRRSSREGYQARPD